MFRLLRFRQGLCQVFVEAEGLDAAQRGKASATLQKGTEIYTA